MKLASSIAPAGRWEAESAVDKIVLDSQDRHRRRVALRGEGGTEFLLDLPQVVALRDGDGLVLEDGSIVAVVGKPEPLFEISARPEEMPGLAWHLGNRHAEIQLVGGKLRIRRDHVLACMLRGLGATVVKIDAPFDPEGGAFSHGSQDVGHDKRGQS